MKKFFRDLILILALFITAQVFSQVTIRDLVNGQGIYTSGQRARLQVIRGQLNGIDANTASYKANPTQYDFDHWHNEIGVLMKDATGGNVFQYSPIKNNDGYRDHFRDVATSAWLDNDLSEAQLVVDYLVRHFNRDELDVSNGQAQYTSNSRHGTF